MDVRRVYLLLATIVQAAFVGMILFAEALQLSIITSPPVLIVDIIVLLLFASSLAFRDWWPKVALAGILGGILSLAITFTDGLFGPWSITPVILTLVPATLAGVAFARRDRLPRLDVDLSSLSKEEREERIRIAKAEAKERKRIFKEEQREREAARLAEMKRRAGRTVLTQRFGLTRVEIFANGYVKVGRGDIEKLVGISGSANVAKKSGVGRGLGAVATAGLNLAGPNIRGDVYLTIITNRKTHSLHQDFASQDDVAAMHKLVAAGEAVLANSRSPKQESPVTATSRSDLAAQLSQLAELHGKGALTDEQYEAAKNKLLMGT